MEALRETNKFLQEEEPWLRKAEEDKPRRLESVRVCLEALYGVSHLLVAFLPTACTRVFEKIGEQSRVFVWGVYVRAVRWLDLTFTTKSSYQLNTWY